ncbi:MAG: LamG domain-containing protein [Sphaerochaeta sp.]|jgi:hypothetical protein|nr:LamG domain-containing protein [Sphaerochaeta sp.]
MNRLAHKGQQRNLYSLSGIDLKDPSLVLYMPLWYPYSDISGSTTLMSYDRYRSTLTNSGSLYSRSGRVFDGDDGIKLDVAAWQSGDDTGTIISFFKTTNAGATKSLFGSCDAPSENGIFLGIRTTNKIAITFYDPPVSGTADIVEGGTTVTDGVMRMAAVSCNGSSYTLSLNGIAETPNVVSGVNGGKWFNDFITGRDNITIGYSQRITKNYFAGTIPAVLYFSRALTLNELQRLYLATKDRYQ